ncbi:MAG TPA: sialate O-acetylesterase [Luteolibacter sp.]|nr:sialate O-acetylesterase [Luteolibacter sp.]
MKAPLLSAVLALILGQAALPAAELATDFPKPPPPLELAPRMGRPFNDNAVFQQQMPIPVWGWTLAGAEVQVSLGQQQRTAKAGADGRFDVKFDALPADKLKSVDDAPVGRTLTVVTSFDGKRETKTFSSILIGEVWLCSGQSNMAVRYNSKGTNLDPKRPALRFLEDDWKVSAADTCGRCYGVSYVFGHKLQGELLVPVGLMNAAVAGTGIEGWWYVAPGDPPTPTKYQNYMPKIEPLVGHAMRGALWYQGEANVKQGKDYLPMLKKLIDGWRGAWKQGDFAFLIVQLSTIGESATDKPEGGDGRAAIRNAQMEALTAIPNTGMAVTIDIGEKREHPQNKYDVGLRLAAWALNKTYDKKDVVPSGPLYKAQMIEGGAIRVKFDHAQHGLMLAKKEGLAPPVPTPDAPMPWLSIQAKDGSWHWADGKIDGSDLIVSSKDVSEPVAVRYAYTIHPAGCNLYNKDGLPASPFSTCGY